jgi:hypothetical protein
MPSEALSVIARPLDIFRKTGRPMEGGLNSLAACDQPTSATRS